MTSLEQLPAIVQETLGGMVAGQDLLHQIQRPKQTRRPAAQLRIALPLSLTALAAAAVLLFALPGLRQSKDAATPQINTLAAGQQPEPAVYRALDIPRDSITIAESLGAASAQAVWETGAGANFPLIRVGGRFFRLLKGQPTFDKSRLTPIGEVERFAEEPALDSSGAAISNIVPAGTSVFELPAFRGAVVLAQLGSDMRVFQRVSFAGTALTGSETLASTLPDTSVSRLVLSDVGTVSQADSIRSLLSLLLGSAVYQGSASVDTDRVLLIEYKEGIVLQMSVKGNSLMACGTWSCPDFFSAFAEALR